MARYVDADSLLNEIETNYSGYIFSENCSPLEFINIIENQPTADVKEVAYSKWIDESDVDFGVMFTCDNCGKPFLHSVKGYNFCPNCGADMRGDK